MAWAVFLRGVNVGKARRVRSADVVAALARHDASSIGAAGTFVVRGAPGERAVRAAVEKALPFTTEVMVVPAGDVLGLLAAPPKAPRGAKLFVSVLGAPPKDTPLLPLERPEGKGWQVRLLSVESRFALSARRNVQGRYYPNEIVEEALGVPATTRGWDTMLAVGEALRQGA